tara:strand:- start:170 stop:337 length:168 start_codon:yes stop_codon:yes gene_type:complete
MAKNKLTDDYNLEKLFPNLKDEWSESKKKERGLVMNQVTPGSEKKSGLDLSRLRS